MTQVQWGSWPLQDAVSQCKFLIINVQEQLSEFCMDGGSYDPVLTYERIAEANTSIDNLWQRLLNSDLV